MTTDNTVKSGSSASDVSKQKKCRLVIDSCCDLPYGVVQSLDVDILEFPFEMSDGTHMDDFGQTMSHTEFYTRMAEGEFPKTAQIPIATLMDKVNEIVESKIPTVILMFSSGLSGTYETLEGIVEDALREHPDAEIYAVDTLLASIAEGVLVLEAVRQRNNGMNARELAQWAKEARYFVHGYFTLDDLKWLRAGGRIPPIAATAAAKLDIKPILTFDLEGHLAMRGFARGRKKSIKTLAKLLDENAMLADGSPLVFGNAVCLPDMEVLKSLYEGEPATVVDTQIGPVIGSHVGPGMLACAFFGPDRRVKDSRKSAKK